ncbi:MAG: hypothetical protein CM1200mP13_02810 [Candidatus Pelagibacterales bacterium]|nr:MAG: hypothetical protein CM1200mP13_02810 [Pelagibacterales bacterium]
MGPRFDGAGPFKKFIYVTFPLMAPISIGAIIIRLIGALQRKMDTVYVLTSVAQELLLKLQVFNFKKKGLREFQMGYAAQCHLLI